MQRGALLLGKVRAGRRRCLSLVPTRVRYAPSPTGALHLGGLRTALYNAFVARQNNGIVVLRIEDTDQKRSVPGCVESMLKTFETMGVVFDEGPGNEGPFGPYVQSQRLDLYREHVQLLVSMGHAYRCFCSSERLQRVRAIRAKQGLPSVYDGHCSRLTKEEASERLANGAPSVVRMRVPEEGATSFDDIVRGRIVVENKHIDQQVLLKSDGFPTYHLASVVDDHAMQISHVIRGEEWLASTAKHILLYSYLGWEPPAFAHLPLLLTTSRAKLSKRHSHGSVESLLGTGYMPEAILHFAATMGWNPSATQAVEPGTLHFDDLVALFELGRVQKGGAQVDSQRMRWLSGEHFREKWAKDPTVVIRMLRSSPSCSDITHLSDSFLYRIVVAVVERVQLLPDVIEFGGGFLHTPELTLDSLHAKGCTRLSDLDTLMEHFSDDASFATVAGLVELLARIEGRLDATVRPLLRCVMFGGDTGPGCAMILWVLGPKRARQRLQAARDMLERGTSNRLPQVA